METVTLKAPPGSGRLDRYLARHLSGKSRSEVQRLIEEGKVLVDQRQRKASFQLEGGETIEVRLPERRPDSPLAPQAISLPILYEDQWLLVVDKPAGLVVHPGAGNPDNTLVNALLAIHPEIASVGSPLRPGIVHRLDKDTSGVMVTAKDQECYLALQKEFAARRVVKKYLLIVRGSVEKERGVIDIPLGRSSQDRKKISTKSRKTREAVTPYRVLLRKGGFSLVEATPKTGRTHQLRVHFAALGHPILGDPLYSGTAKRLFPRLALHARKLGFTHPMTGQALCFFSTPPAEFFAFFRKMANPSVRP